MIRLVSFYKEEELSSTFLEHYPLYNISYTLGLSGVAGAEPSPFCIHKGVYEVTVGVS